MKKFLLRSFRFKLVGIYSVFIILSFLAFSHWILVATKDWFYEGVDNALLHSAKSIDRFLVALDKPQVVDSTKIDINRVNDTCRKYSTKEEIRSLELLKVIHESISLNPRRHYIQIIDNNNTLTWRSKNLAGRRLPTFPDKKELEELRTYAESVYKYDTIPRYVYRRSLKGQMGDTVFVTVPFEKADMRLYITKTKDYTISLGYSLSWMQEFLDKLSSIFYTALPITIIVLIILLLIATKFSYKPIEDMTDRINAINPKNLSDRLPKVAKNDEMARHTDAINRLLEMVERNFNKFKNYSYDASHELKTPLMILRGELELALNSTETVEEFQAVIASNLDEVIRLSNIVETLLKLARAESGEAILDIQKTDMTCLLNDIAQDVEIIAEDKAITLQTNIEKNVRIDADKSGIHQAILNLLENSVKYTPKNGSIYINLQKDGENIVLSIKDTGVGISEEYTNLIFDKFYRAPNAKNLGIAGTGLGLPIVKWMIEAHGGTISVESKLGEGTNFIITLPIKQNER